MESFSVNVNNRFALFLDDEDDPGDVIMPAPVKKEESTKSTKISKQPVGKGVKGKENKDKISQQANKKPAENGNKSADRPLSNSKGPQRSTGGRERMDNRRDRERGDRDDRPPRAPKTGRPRLSSKEKDGEGGFGNHSQGDQRDERSSRDRGTRPFRGGRGGNTGGGGGGLRKREFERHSGNDKSSVKPTEKREGGGAHNWGRQEDQPNDEWTNEEEPPQETEPVTNGEATEDKTGEEQADEAAPVDEEPEEMTLEEYRAKNPTGRVKAEVAERKAGENVDNTQWKNTFQLEKTGEEEFFSGTREVIEKPKTSGRIKTTIDTTGFFFKDQARRGRGRTAGGPGASRGTGRRDGEERRDDGDRRVGRGDGDRRGDRGDGDRRGDRGDGDRRGDRGDGDRRGDRGDGDRRGERGDGERRFGRGDGDRRGGRGDGDRRRGRGDGDRRGGRGDGDRRDGRGDGDRRVGRGDGDRQVGRGDGDRRDGRGERRPFGGGGGGGGVRKRDYAPNVEDEKDFPSLGAQ